MPVLDNAKHELFAQGLAKGQTATDAHEAAGYKRNDGNASTLAAKPEIDARVKEIKGAGAERAECTVASIIAELEEARSLAIGIKQPAPAVSASMGKAKVAGLLIDKAELTGKDGGPVQTVELSDYDMARAVGFLLAKGVNAKPTEH